MTHFDLVGQFADAETGRLERRVSASRWQVPKRILIDGDRLRWAWTAGQGYPGITPDRLNEPARGLLEGFLQLRDAPPSTVLKYARRWGVLGLCEHDFPAQHPAEYWPSRAIEVHGCPYAYDDPYGHGPLRSFKAERNPTRQSKSNARSWPYRRGDFHVCHPRGIYEKGWYVGKPWEPIEGWRTWARRAHALLAVSAALQQKKLGAEADWRMATDTDMERPATRTEGWELLAYYADYWLRAANVRPWPQFQDGQVRVTLGSDWGHSPLFGAIAIQLVLAICGAQSFVLCDACQTIYAPTRSPRAGERHYCDTCRERKVPQRIAAARYRRGETKKRR